jgi:hypothetical protein
MRLPGTLNIPDKKKLAKGRKLALARLVEWNGTRYDLSEFTPAPAVQFKSERSGEGVKLSGNLAKTDLDKLPKQISSKPKTIILQGEDAEDVNRFPSRSEALFYVCCELIRSGVDDDTIASIIMDRDLGISASVLDKPRPHQYAARQIQRAREEVESPELRELNDLHAVIEDMGGKCRVITEVEDPVMDGRKRISRQTFEDFRNRYLNRHIQVGKKVESLGNWWLKHPRRRQHRSVVFAPNRIVEADYNLWKGFAFEPIPGDCSLFLDHVRNNICDRNEEHFEIVMNWMARAVQQPDSIGEVAIVLRGGRGTGKSFFARMFGSLFGAHFLQVSDPKHLVGSFNSHLRDTIVLFADEAFYAGDKKHESILKTLVTEPTFIVEGKGIAR